MSPFTDTPTTSSSSSRRRRKKRSNSVRDERTNTISSESSGYVTSESGHVTSETGHVTSDSNHVTLRSALFSSPPVSPNTTLNVSSLSINDESAEEDDPIVNDTNEPANDLDIIVNTCRWKRSERYCILIIHCMIVKLP